MLQAYVDDSGRGQNPFVLAGYIAPAEKWVQFSERWRALLDGEGGYQRIAEFKMRKVANTVRNRRRCALFYSLIEQHADVAISYTVDTLLYKRIVHEHFPEPLASSLDNPWDQAVGGLMWLLSRNQQSFGLNSPVDFIFDNATEKARCLHGFEVLKQLNLLGHELMGDTPAFRDSTKCLPLQAADMYAWRVRRWQEGGVIYGPQIRDCQFWWPRIKPLPFSHAVADEASIRASMEKMQFLIANYGAVPPWAEQ